MPKMKLNGMKVSYRIQHPSERITERSMQRMKVVSEFDREVTEEDIGPGQAWAPSFCVGEKIGVDHPDRIYIEILSPAFVSYSTDERTEI